MLWLALNTIQDRGSFFYRSQRVYTINFILSKYHKYCVVFIFMKGLKYMISYVEEQIGPVPDSWWGLEPTDLDYGVHEFNILAARFKASDVVECFCLARSLLIDSTALDNKVIRKDTRIFYKASILQSSLMHYISAWDLSWQVYWFKYIVTPDVRIVTSERLYDKLSSQCTYRNLKEKLEKKEDYSIIKFLASYQENEFWKSLRKSYNYIKHSGAFHISGLGINPKKGVISINERKPNLISRHDFNINEWTDKLIRYNGEFISYFNQVFQEVIYEKSVMKFESGTSNEDTIKMIKKIKEYL